MTFTKINGTRNSFVAKDGKKFYLATAATDLRRGKFVTIPGSYELVPSPGGKPPKVFRSATAVEKYILTYLAMRNRPVKNLLTDPLANVN